MFSVRVDDRAVVAALGEAGSICHADLEKAIVTQAIELEAFIKNELSGSSTGPFPAKRTGALRNSITYAIESSAFEIMASVFSGGDVKYAEIMEKGSAPHDIYPINAKALAFKIQGEMVFAKVVHHPGTPPLPFMEPGLEARTPYIIAAMEKAATEGLMAALS